MKPCYCQSFYILSCFISAVSSVRSGGSPDERSVLVEEKMQGLSISVPKVSVKSGCAQLLIPFTSDVMISRHGNILLQPDEVLPRHDLSL